MLEDGWIITGSGNRIHQSCNIQGSRYIVFEGHTTMDHDCTAIVKCNSENDKSMLTIGNYSYINPGCSIYVDDNKVTKIGSYTSIGEGTKIDNARIIGSHSQIGRNCIIGQNCTVCDCTKIDDHVKLPCGFSVPAYTQVDSNLELSDLKSTFKTLNDTQLKNKLLI